MSLACWKDPQVPCLLPAGHDGECVAGHEHQWGLATEHMNGYVVASCTYPDCTTAKTVPYIPRSPKEHQVDMPQYMLDAGPFEGLDDLPAYRTEHVTDPTATAAANVILADIANSGGGTYETGTLIPFRPTEGYAVGLGGIKLNTSLATADGILWATRHAAAEYGTSFVGTWLDGDTVHIDAVIYFTDKASAVLAGIRARQLAIYDFAAGEAINIAYTTEDHDR